VINTCNIGIYTTTDGFSDTTVWYQNLCKDPMELLLL